MNLNLHTMWTKCHRICRLQDTILHIFCTLIFNFYLNLVFTTWCIISFTLTSNHMELPLCSQNSTPSCCLHTLFGTCFADIDIDMLFAHDSVPQAWIFSFNNVLATSNVLFSTIWYSFVNWPSLFSQTLPPFCALQPLPNFQLFKYTRFSSLLSNHQLPRSVTTQITPEFFQNSPRSLTGLLSRPYCIHSFSITQTIEITDIQCVSLSFLIKNFASRKYCFRSNILW